MDSVHKDHRQRKRLQFIEHGSDAFADHELLELLLFYGIARKDVNALAHALIEEFGARCVTVFLGGDTEAFYRRYVERDRAHLRHPGHVVQEHYPLLPGETADHDMTREEFRDKFEKRGMADVRLQGERIDVDATDPAAIDVEALITQIRHILK